MIGKEAPARRDRGHVGVGLEIAGRENGARRLPCRRGRIDRALDGGIAHFGVEVGRAVHERTDRRIGLRPELRHQLRVLRRETRQRDRQVDGAFQRRIVEHVGR